MNHYVYITTNLINGKQYVGDHTINIHQHKYYLGSGSAIESAFKKYLEINFFKEILEWFDTREEAFNAQEKYINEFNTLSPNGYNLSPKGGLRVKGCHSVEAKAKIGKANKIKRTGTKATPETLLKMSFSMIEKNKGKIMQSTQKEYLKQLYSGKTYEEIYGKEKAALMIEKNRIAHKGKTHTEEARKKMSVACTGRKVSEETKQKIRNTFLLKKVITND